MSIVVALKHDNHVYLASDSQITFGEHKKINRSFKSQKIWHPDQHPNIALGTTGFVRERNVIQASSDILNQQKYIEATPFDIHTIVNDIIPQMFELYEKHQILPESTGSQKFNNEYLLAVRDQLYEISKCGSVIEIENFTATGHQLRPLLDHRYGGLFYYVLTIKRKRSKIQLSKLIK